MPLGLNVKGEDTYYGDIGRADTGSAVGGTRSYNFQVGQGLSATTSASSAGDSTPDISKYVPWIIVAVVALIAAVLFAPGGRK